MTAVKPAPPRPGDQFRHVETGTVATFVGWRDRPDWLGGGRLMVLHHPRFRECVWHPSKATAVRGEP